MLAERPPPFKGAERKGRLRTWIDQGGWLVKDQYGSEHLNGSRGGSPPPCLYCKVPDCPLRTGGIIPRTPKTYENRPPSSETI